MCVGAGLALLLLNLLFRIGAEGDRERDDEQAAREYLATHGHWPDEKPTPLGALGGEADLVRAHDAVAAGALGRVERAVGLVEQSRGRCRRAAACGDAEGDRQRAPGRPSGRTGGGAACRRRWRRPRCSVSGSSRPNSSPPSRPKTSERRIEPRHDVADRRAATCVAGRVAEGVVESLEVVDVEDRRARAARRGAAARASSASSRCSKAPRLSAPVSESWLASVRSRSTSASTCSRRTTIDRGDDADDRQHGHEHRQPQDGVDPQRRARRRRRRPRTRSWRPPRGGRGSRRRRASARGRRSG